MIKTIHPIAGAVALLLILMFWLSTVFSGLFASVSTVSTVKMLIPWGFVILIPALMVTGMTGFRLSKNRHAVLVGKKQRRMTFVSANGLLILIPAALYLSFNAQTGSFDVAFYLVQVLELIAGAVNIVLLGLNMRDGLKLTGKSRHPT